MLSFRSELVLVAISPQTRSDVRDLNPTVGSDGVLRWIQAESQQSERFDLSMEVLSVM